MSDCPRDDPPSAFIVDWSARVGALWTSSTLSTLSTLPTYPTSHERPRALDVAAGRGRHSEALTQAGYRVFAVDISPLALIDARTRVERRGGQLGAWTADLSTRCLPERRFDLVVVTRYLQRDLFPSLREAVRPGGVVLYETFTEAQRDLGWGPRSAEHLLEAGELRRRFDGFEILFYEEIASPEAVGRIVARRPR